MEKNILMNHAIDLTANY